MANKDITEDIPYDLASLVEETTFTITDTAYDLTIDNVPFMMSVSNQNPYVRQTAQYRKDQFDNSTEPGEQSLTGWWLRSQTSFHNGAGIEYYEPGTDYEHVSNRYEDSRGVDVWTVGQASLLNDVFHSYTGAGGIVSSAANDGTNDILVSGDNAGALKKITFNGDLPATSTTYAMPNTTLSPASAYALASHTTFPFLSVTTDGSRYFAVCSRAIHRGNTSTADQVIYHLGAAKSKAVIKYVKNFLLLGLGRELYLLNPDSTTGLSQHDAAGSNLPPVGMTHKSADWNWTDIVGGTRHIYAIGKNNSKSEIWAIPFDETAATIVPDLASAIVVAELPFGEYANAIYFYLGFLAVGTTKGIRVARIASDATGAIVLGPLLFEVDENIDHPNGITPGVTGFVANNSYIWASTCVAGDNGNVNACLVRVDLGTEFTDGIFPYAYDLQYESDKDSYCSGVHYANGRLHLIVSEPEELPAGEIQSENLSQKRTTGWLKTGKIRFGMIEPKYFKYINAAVDTGTGDSVTIEVIDQNGTVKSVSDVTVGLSNQDIPLSVVKFKQEQISFKFTLNNVNTDSGYPILYGYQLKAVPATRRQRLIQYPLSCFNTERDHFDVEFGWSGRAIEVLQKLEAIEQTGRFVTITDYRTNEIFEGIIEEVRFTNESSPDRDSSGFGGLLLVTVRKM